MASFVDLVHSYSSLKSQCESMFRHRTRHYESLTLRAEFKELNERDQSSPASFLDPDAKIGDDSPGAGCSTDPLPEKAPP